jgi:hypothetical protein
MHIAQLLLLEADTHQEAVGKVSDILDSRSGDFWSDWWDVNGGRWQGAFGENAPNVICYNDDPEFFDEHIEKFLEGRKENIKRHLEHNEISTIDFETLVDTYDPYMEDFPRTMKMWAVKNAVRTMAGEWTYDTGVYDLENETAYMGAFVVRAKETPKRQFGVLVDFHF